MSKENDSIVTQSYLDKRLKEERIQSDIRMEAMFDRFMAKIDRRFDVLENKIERIHDWLSNHEDRIQRLETVQFK